MPIISTKPIKKGGDNTPSPKTKKRVVITQPKQETFPAPGRNLQKNPFSGKPKAILQQPIAGKNSKSEKHYGKQPRSTGSKNQPK
jgi:hypothetical protein